MGIFLPMSGSCTRRQAEYAEISGSKASFSLSKVLVLAVPFSPERRSGQFLLHGMLQRVLEGLEFRQ